MIHVGFNYVYVKTPIYISLVLSCYGLQKFTFFNRTLIWFTVMTDYTISVNMLR